MRLYLNCKLAKEDITVRKRPAGRLIRLMGLEAIYQKPRTTVKSGENAIYPYLLKGLAERSRPLCFAVRTLLSPRCHARTTNIQHQSNLH